MRTKLAFTYASTESRFFNTHRTDNIKEQRLVKYLMQRNAREHFVLPTVARIGYPRWDKTVLLSAKSIFKTRGAGRVPSGEVYIIPFVRDSAMQVNAGMIVYAGADTTLQYVCDWHCKDSAAVGMNSKDQMLLLMSLDQKVFGNRLYRIKDTASFGRSSERGNAV